MREMLIRGSIMMMHDNLFGELPIYHFFAESLINGNFRYGTRFQPEEFLSIRCLPNYDFSIR